MILTISGASGSGKSSLIKEILRVLPSAQRATSFSTRARRLGESPADLQTVSQAEFQKRSENGDFLWTVEVHGNKYATSRTTVVEGLNNTNSWMLIEMAPVIVQTIRTEAAKLKLDDAVRSIYVLSPTLDVLRKRLRERGEDDISISDRLSDCKDWDGEASTQLCYALLIRGYGDLFGNAQTVLRYLSAYP